MRHRIVTLALVLLAACGGSDATAPQQPAPTLVYFRIDALTCKGTSVVNFFIDGVQVGSEPMTAGSLSKGYSTTVGSHVLGARTTEGYTWPNTTMTVTSAGVTDILPCG